MILAYSDHPVLEEFVLLASGQRYRLLRSKSNRYKLSFVPTGMNALFLTKV